MDFYDIKHERGEERKREDLILSLENRHDSYNFAVIHDSHVLSWLGALPAIIRLLRSQGQEDKQIGSLFALSVTSVRWIESRGPHVIVASIVSSGRSQRAVAALCGISQPRVCNLIRGQLELFSIDSMLEIAGALGCQASLIVVPFDKPASMKDGFIFPSDDPIVLDYDD